jgi:hypothetical protein
LCRFFCENGIGKHGNRTAIPAKPASPDAARPSETGFRKLSPEKPVNNAGPVTFSAGIAGNRIGISRENQLIFEMNVRFFKRVNRKR